MSPRSREELDNKWRIILHTAFLSALVVIIVAIRIASRLLQWGRLSIAEYLLLVATVVYLAFNGSIVYAVQVGGLGLHINNVSASVLVTFIKYYFAAAFLIPTCFALAKLSLLWLLHKVFAHTWFRHVARALALVIVAWWVATIVVEVRLCYPVKTRWQGGCAGKHSVKSFLILPIPWIVTDWLILLTPLPVLWQSIDTRRPYAMQVGLVTLFSLGIVTCCISIKRYLMQMTIKTSDLTFTLVNPTIWQMIDMSTTICCAALPGSMFALRRMIPVDLLKSAVDWVEQKWEATKRCTFVSRNRTFEDMEANPLPVPVDAAQRGRTSLAIQV